MEIKIIKESFQKGLSVTERIATKSLTLPILNNILLEVEDNFISLSATDLETGVKWWSIAKTEDQGKIVIPSKILSQFISLLPEQPLDIDIKEDLIKVKSGTQKTQLKGLNSEDFPIIPTLNKENVFIVNSQTFCEASSKVVKIPSTSSIKPEISGIYISFKKDEIKLAATDSFRLGEKTIPLTNKTEIKKETSLIIPQKTVEEIINIFNEKDVDLHISFSPDQILFESFIQDTDHPEVQLISKLIEGDYPDYESIIPKETGIKVTLPTKDFIKQVRAAGLFGGKINEIRVNVHPKDSNVEFLSSDSDLGDYQSFLEGKIEGNELSISFNHRFLLEGLNNIKSSEVTLELNSDDSPGIIRPIGDNTYFYIIMPIKTD
jgi:DNA polymerase-3 subunit beta